MIIRQIEVMGLAMDEWKHKSCTAQFGVGGNWATLYSIESAIRNQGHATILLKTAKRYYEARGKRFGGSVALHPAMRHLYRKLGITEYYGEDGAIFEYNGESKTVPRVRKKVRAKRKVLSCTVRGKQVLLPRVLGCENEENGWNDKRRKVSQKKRRAQNAHTGVERQDTKQNERGHAAPRGARKNTRSASFTRS